MNQAIKRRWLERLRSGEVEQAKGYLACADARCCLGVLCDLYIEDHLDVVWELDDDDDSAPRMLFGHCSVLPDSVVEWAGLSDSAPDVLVPEVKGHEPSANLTACNDGSTFVNRRTFAEIADIIEAQL